MLSLCRFKLHSKFINYILFIHCAHTAHIVNDRGPWWIKRIQLKTSHGITATIRMHNIQWKRNIRKNRTWHTQPTNWIKIIIIIIFDAHTNLIVKKGSALQCEHTKKKHSTDHTNEWMNETIVFIDTVVGLLVSLEEYLPAAISACEWVRPDNYRGALNNDFVLEMHISFDAVF